MVVLRKVRKLAKKIGIREITLPHMPYFLLFGSEGCALCRHVSINYCDVELQVRIDRPAPSPAL